MAEVQHKQGPHGSIVVLNGHIILLLSCIFIPPFCNLHASRKRGGGGLYAGSVILSREYAHSSEAGLTPVCLCFSRRPET